MIRANIFLSLLSVLSLNTLPLFAQQPTGELLQEKDIPTLEPIPTAKPVEEIPSFVAPATEMTLVDAVLQNNESLVELLLKQGRSINEVNEIGETPLCAALQEGLVPMAMYLLLNGADPNLKGSQEQAPLIYASLRRHPLLIPTLLEAGADPNTAVQSPPNESFLSSVSDPSLKKQLKTHHGMTPLMISAFRGDVEAVSALIQHKAKTNAFTKPYSRYAINFAAQKNYLYIMRLLLGRKPESEPRVLITINLSTQKAKLEVEGKMVLETSISTGRKGYETPPGRYVITNRYKTWTSTIYKVPMPYFLRLNCSAIGLHSGYVTGRPASHGCIRLPKHIAPKFYSMTNVGDEVTIEF